MAEKNYKIFLFEWLLVLVAIFFTFLIVATSAYFIFENFHKNKIYPGISLGQLNLSGLTADEARKTINQKISDIHQNGILFYYNDTYTTVQPIITSAETDLSYDIIDFDVDETIQQIYQLGREGGFFERTRQKFNFLMYGQNVNLKYGININELKKILANNFSEYEVPCKNARLNFVDGKFLVEEETIGKIIDYDNGIIELQKKLISLNTKPITLESIIDYPEINKEDTNHILADAEKFLSLSPISLEYGDFTWVIEEGEFAQWLMIDLMQTDQKTQIVLALDKELIGLYLNENISPDVNIEPIDAKFEFEQGRVMEFQASTAGLELNVLKSLLNLETELKKGSSSSELVVNDIESKIKTQDVNDLGIQEIIGIGHSNFAGSPMNRRHNIRTGANTLHGILIKPEEEFSLVGTLGEIDAKSGYLTELVIKGNKTIPEYGGGLCQIGTTMFRTALDTGLDITMRRNHSYRVSYYEPAGTDATIYDPWPDLRFINDTNNNILIQSEIDGNDLYFYFWGTNDGRIASRTDPTIYNITRPGPTKYIETLDLEPGVKKCTEHAHNGADAYFDYFIKYADGERKEERFKSHYVPWQEVCLLGVEELSAETGEDKAEETKNASSTKETAIQ